jgi:hypothetical protein
MAKIEAVIKNKEAECEMLERKAMALKTLSSMKEQSELMGDTQYSKQFHKRVVI